jgi:hypothetical protein
MCKNNSFTNIVEFGPGKGDLAISLIKATKNIGTNIKWSGIEINEKLCNTIKDRFKKEGLEENLKEIVSLIDNIIFDKKVIFIFSMERIREYDLYRLGFLYFNDIRVKHIICIWSDVMLGDRRFLHTEMT